MFVGCIFAGVAILWAGIGVVVSLVSGWRSLAERYRTEREFPEHKRRMQSAQMRVGANYNNILTLASDAEGLYMGLTINMFPGHPRLFIPWADVVTEEPRRYLFLMVRMFRLGPSGIPLRVRESLAEFLLEGKAASGMPGQASSMKWGI